jgi:hypothetical protein
VVRLAEPGWVAVAPGGVMDDPGRGTSDGGAANPPVAVAFALSPSPFRMEGPSDQTRTDTTANAATAIPILATARMVSLEMVLMGWSGVGDAAEAAGERPEGVAQLRGSRCDIGSRRWAGCPRGVHSGTSRPRCRNGRVEGNRPGPGAKAHFAGCGADGAATSPSRSAPPSLQVVSRSKMLSSSRPPPIGRSASQMGGIGRRTVKSTAHGVAGRRRGARAFKTLMPKVPRSGFPSRCPHLLVSSQARRPRICEPFPVVMVACRPGSRPVAHHESRGDGSPARNNSCDAAFSQVMHVPACFELRCSAEIAEMAG